MNRDLEAAAVAEISNQRDWVYQQWLDLNATRLYKLPIKCCKNSSNPAIEEMNAEIRERAL
ncbi:MAG: hypothetical protein U9Q77_02815 [Candidatus Marinimicrobia bacterium]|nr:hypothetical protein [Candidatus Neomarinimicrobiota bacterium]